MEKTTGKINNLLNGVNAIKSIQQASAGTTGAERAMGLAEVAKTIAAFI